MKPEPEPTPKQPPSSLPPYCLPIFDRPWSEVPRILALESHRYAAFELWVDRLPGFDPGDWSEVSKESARPLLALFGRSSGADAGRAEPIDRSRARLIYDSLSSRDWIDLDVVTQADVWAEIESSRCGDIEGPRHIASYHDFSSTPGDAELEAIETRLRARAAELIKISTFCRNDRDAARLLSLRAKWSEEGIPSIVFGMGAAGRATRIFGPLWGNALIYAPAHSEEASAPGQIDRDQLERIFDTLQAWPETRELG